MTMLKILFAGEIKKAEHRMAGQDPICELQICKKNKTKEGDEPTFTWIRVTCWKPADFIVPRLVVGAFVTGCGDFSLRSYEKDGVKRQSAEVRCGSFDVEVGGHAEKGAGEQWPARPAAAPAQRAPAPSASSVNDDSPPFARSELEMMP